MNDIGRNKTNYCTQLSDQTDEKTALLKALLNLKDVENDTIEVLLNMAENTGDLKKNLINASYTEYKQMSADV